eukprot:Clim_evm103s152 gene=Clim_evmTU103s152
MTGEEAQVVPQMTAEEALKAAENVVPGQEFLGTTLSSNPNKAKKQAEKLAKFLAKQEKLKSKGGDGKAKDGKAKEEKKAKVKAVAKQDNWVDPTKPGEKKILGEEMDAGYDPRRVESSWGKWWEKEGFYKPEYGGRDVQAENPKGKFVMVIPPPNVTGVLHIGHALTMAVEDTLTRWHRMRGETVLWNPGCDHAGIATQVVVEKRVQRLEGKTRHDLGREEFLKRVWDYKNEFGGIIYDQLRAMGTSFDWDRANFTMDDDMVEAVLEAFVRLYNDGKIYRATRLVNWCSKLNSAISDLEVDNIEIEGNKQMPVPNHSKESYTFGTLTEFAYRICPEGKEDADPGAGAEEIIVATTRLETMLGDTAVAVHPDDPRYIHLHGRKVWHPLRKEAMPIILDKELVDMEFGTGAVKITPAHDPNDYEAGKRHNLPMLCMLNDNGTINDLVPEFEGQMRFDARITIGEKLKELGLLKEIKSHNMTLPICSRTKDIVEPMLKPQWFVKMDEMAAAALKYVEDGELNLTPVDHVKTWRRWLENPRDWCISRQLWWGHRVPAWRILVDGQPVERDETVRGAWVIARNQKDALAQAKKQTGIEDESRLTLEQDPDVLDTWFSSGLFPFATQGWPRETPDMKAFFPNTLLETGHDIIFFWVARMVMMSWALLGQCPFQEVYLHAMIRDAHGRKMSKSLGNVIDPRDIITGISLEGLHEKLENGNLDPKELKRARAGQKADYPEGIPQCGTDAMRFGLMAYTAQGRDINLDVLRLQGYRFFCNKLWNATKFALMRLGKDYKPEGSSINNKGPAPTNPIDSWMLSRLNYCIVTVQKAMNEYMFPDATTALYNFWLYDLCDIYLENMKMYFPYNAEPKDWQVEGQKRSRAVLYHCLDQGLKLMAPFMPFLTEELWQRLPRYADEKCPSIHISAYPEADNAPQRNEEIEAQVSEVMECVSRLRSLKSEYLTPKVKPAAFILCNVHDMKPTLEPFARTIVTLANVESVQILMSGEDAAPKHCAMDTVGDRAEAYIYIKGLVEPGKEIKKLEGKVTKLQSQIANLSKRMDMDGYVQKVPADVRAKNAEQKEAFDNELIAVKKAIAMYQNWED